MPRCPYTPPLSPPRAIPLFGLQVFCLTICGLTIVYSRCSHAEQVRSVQPPLRSDTVVRIWKVAWPPSNASMPFSVSAELL